MKDTHKEGGKDTLGPSFGGSPAVAVASAVARTTTATTRQPRQKRAAVKVPKKPSPFTAPQWGELRQAVERLHGAARLPLGWSLRNDLSIVKQMGRRWGFEDILAMIDGLAVLRSRGDVDWIHPREAVTLRALRKMSGVESVAHKALAAGWQSRNTKAIASPKKSSPASLSSLIAKVMPNA